ncbi:hypothetical protein BJF92_08205 [Rhizobium rhizosphaerae]|uniref:PTS EIIA type-2 domain-containing protein n=1 Tax=Xaviernesmea rhizosphaerae TaxID=1672749 RepID=A0A1Q9AK31_9HYPH|nr:PTS sugar transporter subunit IIA [Xaviernesmea rhizosphaerae]OLP55644.1 hypothetical protein BJF92_08205 [Xaviernesmea rhizosphaerae]
MILRDHLPAGHVLLGRKAASKSALIALLAEAAAERSGLAATPIRAALSAREALGSTGVGKGVAVPHAMVEGLDKVVCLFVRLDRPVDFAAVDDEPVDLVFLVLVPPVQRSQSLSLLSALARRLRESDAARGLRAAPSAEAALAILAPEE